MNKKLIKDTVRIIIGLMIMSVALYMLHDLHFNMQRPVMVFMGTIVFVPILLIGCYLVFLRSIAKWYRNLPEDKNEVDK